MQKGLQANQMGLFLEAPFAPGSFQFFAPIYDIIKLNASNNFFSC